MRYFSRVREISAFKLSFYYILHAERSARDGQCRCNRIQFLKFNHSSIRSITKRYFFRVWDISTFKRPFYSIVHAERSARDSLCRCSRIQLLKFNHSSIWSKTKRYFFGVWDMSTFKRLFYSILHAERSARYSQCRCKRIQLIKFNHSSIWSKTKRYFSPDWDIVTLCYVRFDCAMPSVLV